MDLRKATEQSWEETSKFDTLFNFKWSPFSYGIRFDNLSKYG